MKIFRGVLLLLVAASPLRAEPPTLSEARQRWLHGNYDEARVKYESLVQDTSKREPAVLGLSRTLQSQGEYDRALEVVEKTLVSLPQSAPLHARLAELLHLRGRWEDADREVQKTLEIHKDNLLGHWVRALLFRDRGELRKADSECRWFVRTYSARSEADQDIKDPDDLLLVGLAGAENARWNRLSDQFHFILNEVYGDALKADKDFWPAEYQAGMLLLEKYNRAEALPAFDKALTINPHAAEALVGKGLAALQRFEIKDAERFAEQALKVNPHLPEALSLRADVHLATGDIAKAWEELETAKKVSPRDEVILGKMAACAFLQRRFDDFQKIIKDVSSRDAKPGMFYFVLGQELEDRRHYREAEKYYQKSAELWPMLPWPQDSLGLLAMRLGKEKEAREILTKAFQADEFNVRVSNSLKVLRHLEKYETVRSTHFEIRFDPHQDAHLARHVQEFLEGFYGSLVHEFGYEPPTPILIEIFNNHEMFSGRTIALPDLHTIGASTGRMVAMVSPRGKGTRKPFNWARVMRHELVHIFNLEQTSFQVPHWFTEGLAVGHEGFSRPQTWNELLLKRAAAKNWLNLDTINLGFIRPRSAEEWTLAYCQSQIYVDFLKTRYGPDVVGKLLSAYKDGLDTTAALSRVCKVSQEEFEKAYSAHLEEIIRQISGEQPRITLGFKELKEAFEKNPNDIDTAARLSELTFIRDKAQARKLVEGVLKQNKKHPLASYVKARLLIAGGEEDDAKKLLEEALDLKTPEIKILELLGKIYYDAKDYPQARTMYEAARRKEPLETKWMSKLISVYSLTGEKEKQIHLLKDVVATDADDLSSRKHLAAFFVEKGQWREAENYARQALEIDVLDPDAQSILGDVLLREKKSAAAITAFRIVLEKKDDATDIRLKLARAYLENKEKDKAAYEIATVLAREPDNATAKELQASLAK